MVNKVKSEISNIIRALLLEIIEDALRCFTERGQFFFDYIHLVAKEISNTKMD